MITCPSCNHKNEIGSSFCENCGHDLSAMTPANVGDALPPASGGTTCSNCGHVNIQGAAFCENCGNPLEQIAPSMPSPEIPEQVDDQLHCSTCGHQNAPGSRFCENCGSELKQVPPIAPPQLSPQPQPEKQPETPSKPALVTGEQICSQCGFSNPAGTVFCGSCGMQLIEIPQVSPESKPATHEAFAAPEPTPEPPPSPGPIPTPSGIGGRFEVNRSGASISVPTGKKEVIIGREDPVSGIFPEIDLDPHGGHDGGVGRRHARLYVQTGQLMVEDQDSVNGTFVNRQKLNAFQPHPLNDGDELRLGKIVLTYHAR